MNMNKCWWLGFLLLGACSTHQQGTTMNSSNRAITHSVSPIPSPANLPRTSPANKPQHYTAPQQPQQKKLASKYYHTSWDGIELYLVAFDDRDFVLRVADQPNGIGSRWTNAKEAAATYGGIAAINGGFFTPEGKPLGLLIETGTPRGSINRSSLGAGIFVSGDRGSALLRKEIYQKSKSSWKAYNLLQSGPMLAENGKTVSGLSNDKHRPRSFIIWDGKHHWAIGQSSSCTLAGLSKALAGRSPAGFDVHTALNLDGGRSVDLWSSSQLPGGGKSHRSLFSKPVRNYLVLKSR